MIATTIRKSIKKLRGKIKKSDAIFSLRRLIVDKDLKRERKAMKKCTLKTQAQIRQEKKIYGKFWKKIPQDYIRYGLFNKQLDIEDIKDYIPMQYYYCDFYDSIFEDINTEARNPDFLYDHFPYTGTIISSLPEKIRQASGNGKDLADKLVQYYIMTERGLKVPAMVALALNNRIYDLQGNEKELDFLKDKISSDNRRIFIKPTDGCGGEGIKVIEKKGDELYFNGESNPSAKSLNLTPGRLYILQEGLEQHESLDRVNDSSVNTLRVLARYEKNQPQILGVILRIGRRGSVVDNSAVGGISVGIDAKTGHFYETGGREHGSGVFDRHPDTGFVFKGASIPEWDSVLEKIKKITGSITEFPLVGWDIALGKHDVYTLEFNKGFGIEHAQTILGGLRKPLGINP